MNRERLPQRRKAAAIGAVHAGGATSGLIRASLSLAGPNNYATRCSLGVGGRPSFPEAFCDRGNPNRRYASLPEDV